MKKILVANRGEIAVRVIRACREMGLGSVAVFSECDRAARHVRMADEAVPIGGNAPAESYLRIESVLRAASRSGADAIHPGYGFLSENEQFARACRDAGLTFIGPTPEAMARMGSKTAARRLAVEAGVPVVPGTDDALDSDVDDARIRRLAQSVGYPLMVKAVAGGGGRGMRVVTAAPDLVSAVRAARSEAAGAFGDSAIYLERRLLRPRHVEVQLLADHHGIIQPFVERECSIQRRHQKVLEESPSPVVTPALRARLAEAAAAIARAARYTNAGTIEFLLDEDGHFYFLEMNTRLQVEHPVTEMVTQIDLVHWQIRIARGERLTIGDDRALTPSGHSIECRVYAEDPDAGFLPSPGRILALRVPQGPGVRDDGWVEEGGEIPTYYDSLLSKLIVWGQDRTEAAARLRRALDEYEVRGVRTSLPFFQWLVDRPDFREARFHTAFLDELLQQRLNEPFDRLGSSLEEVAAIAVCVIEASRGGADSIPAGTHARQHGRQVSHEGGWKRRGRLEGLRP